MNFLSYRPFTEIEFLSNQNMVFSTGTRGATGTICTITPADGLTFVLLGALAAPSALGVVGGTMGYAVELRNEANVRAILGGAGVVHGGTSSGAGFGHCPSFVRGDTLEGDGIKTYTLEVIAVVATTIRGSLWGYTRNT